MAEACASVQVCFTDSLWLVHTVVTFRKARLNPNSAQAETLFVCVCVCIYEAVQLKTKLQHAGTWSVAASLPRRLCYRPALFSSVTFVTLRVHYHKEKFGALFYFSFFTPTPGEAWRWLICKRFPRSGSKQACTCQWTCLDQALSSVLTYPMNYRRTDKSLARPGRK